jgi:hypothetical protein
MNELERLMQQAEAKSDPDVMKSADELFADIVARAEVAEGRFVADYLTKMFAADYFQRSNSKKASLYSILQSAVEQIALFEDGYSPAEKLANLVARAEFFLDEPNPVLFKAAIIQAFERSKFSQFGDLGRAIRGQEATLELRRVASRMIASAKSNRIRQVPSWAKIRVPARTSRKSK